MMRRVDPNYDEATTAAVLLLVSVAGVVVLVFLAIWRWA